MQILHGRLVFVTISFGEKSSHDAALSNAGPSKKDQTNSFKIRHHWASVSVVVKWWGRRWNSHKIHFSRKKKTIVDRERLKSSTNICGVEPHSGHVSNSQLSTSKITTHHYKSSTVLLLFTSSSGGAFIVQQHTHKHYVETWKIFTASSLLLCTSLNSLCHTDLSSLENPLELKLNWKKVVLLLLSQRWSDSTHATVCGFVIYFDTSLHFPHIGEEFNK